MPLFYTEGVALKMKLIQRKAKLIEDSRKLQIPFESLGSAIPEVSEVLNCWVFKAKNVPALLKLVCKLF